MATHYSSSFLNPLPCLPRPLPRQKLSFWFPLISNKKPRKIVIPPLVSASSAYYSSDDLSSRNPNRSHRFQYPKKLILSSLIHEIEPLDVSLVQKDVPPGTVDAMKRTISGMLGLLPSDQFQVLIEALWQPLSKLLVSSMMTGYTLRNAEYRLCLERNLDINEENSEKQTLENSPLNVQGMLSEGSNIIKSCAIDELSPDSGNDDERQFEDIDEIQGLGEISTEAEHYIRHLKSQLSSIKKDLHEVKRRSAALQMQQFVGEEKNDLLDYLRSLQPEKVAELSEPTSIEVKEAIHSVVHGLLATLSPKIHSKTHPLSENTSAGSATAESGDCAEIIENTSIQFQPLISLTRDYLARLLFWCMLLGHYIRGLEYRMELVELLSLTSDAGSDASGGKQVA